MNSKAQTLGISILTSLFILIIGLMSINFLMPEIASARLSLNCPDANSISDGVKLFCLMEDLTVPYWVIIIFSLVIGGITARLLL